MVNIDLNEFISGERLQELADVTHIGVMNSNMEGQLPNTKTTLRDKANFYLNDNENIVFVYGHDLDLFFKETYPKINKQIKIISHNTDEPVSERFKQFLNQDKLIHWYAQNAVLDHPKLTPIPIGIANKQWPHGNLQTLKAIIDSNIKKELLVYKNFDNNTNIAIRRAIDFITSRNGIGMSERVPHKNYLEKMASSLFVISPPGNGIDCHRIWEALYLNCIPVIQRNTCFRSVSDLPILFIDDWNEVTIPFLRNKVTQYIDNKQPKDKLLLSYWRKLIRND